jgi:hypothetical protein
MFLVKITETPLRTTPERRANTEKEKEKKE